MSGPSDALPRVLLVEGVDDKHVTCHLLEQDTLNFSILVKCGFPAFAVPLKLK